MSPVTIPHQIRSRLVPAVRTLAPLLDSDALASAADPMCGIVCRATVDAVRHGVTAPSAVYVAWDARCWCRYVGSVFRESTTAVSARLNEHH